MLKVKDEKCDHRYNWVGKYLSKGRMEARTEQSRSYILLEQGIAKGPVVPVCCYCGMATKPLHKYAYIFMSKIGSDEIISAFKNGHGVLTGFGGIRHCSVNGLISEFTETKRPVITKLHVYHPSYEYTSRTVEDDMSLVSGVFKRLDIQGETYAAQARYKYKETDV